MKRYFTKANALRLLVLILVVQFGLLGWLWHEQRQTNRQMAQELQTDLSNQVSTSNGASYQRVVISPATDKIYLPELRLQLPLSSLGLSLVYSPDTAYVTGSYKVPTGPYDEASLSTLSTAGASQSQTRLNCSELVRIKIEARPSPYNPHEIAQAPVKLADGRILQVYAMHQSACDPEWRLTTANPDAIAALFQDATSY